MSQRKFVFAVSMVASVSFVAACSGKKNTVSPDASVAIDAFVSLVDAPPPCLISSMDFGAKGALTGGATYDPGTPMTAGDPAFPAVRMRAPMSAGAKPDIVIVELLAGFAPWGTGTAPLPPKAGTYPLTGPQLNYETCGTCVRARAAVESGTVDGGDFFVTGGTLVITEVGTKVGDKFTMELKDVGFEQVTYADMTFHSTPLGNNCKTKLTSATFTGTMTAEPAKPTADGQPRVRYTLKRAD
jgi:hypothetical protein